MNIFFKKISRSLPHPLVYYGYKIFYHPKYKALQALRYKEADEGEYSLKGFDEHNCIFIHIPKTGGLSLSLSLFGNRGGGHRTYHSYYPIYSPKEYQQYYKFAIVRNPWDRLVSAYFFLKSGGITQADQRWLDQNLSEYESFHTFVNKWVTPENIYSYLHFIPQHYYVAHNNNIMIDEVYKLENIASAIDDINEKLGVHISMPHKNKTKSRSSDYHDYYTEETKKIVEEVYQQDIKLFGYSF